MIRYSLILLLLCAGTIVGRVESSAPLVEKSCRQHPQVIGKCFTVRGRLSVYNGAPTLRLWRVGTNRMLGISEQRYAQDGYRNIPENLERQVNQGVSLFGDFEVCPFTRSQPREMQMVCIEAGKNLVARKRDF